MKSADVLFGIFLVGLLDLTTAATGVATAATGSAQAGARAFQACASCHALEPGRNLTGPTLAGIWGRKAGTGESFTRYSNALKASNVVWNEQSLDRWLTDPKALVPNNYMVFPGVRDPKARGDIIAFLKAASEGGLDARTAATATARAPQLENLKSLGADQQVASISYCRDSYRVTTVAGPTTPFWEFNLRFKTDSSDNGPTKNHPVLLPASMGGDRAFLIFSAPDEISSFVKEQC